MAKITAVQKGGIGEEIGLEAGDELLGFNGEQILDVLDYAYYDSQEVFTLNLRTKQGELADIEIEKTEDETLGLELDESVQLEPMRCKNKCLFCFVDQLPEGMRKTLYVKDDDYRLSFVSGNYVTLSNIGQKELDRIAKLKLSPLYISVHAYDRAVKTKLVSNPESAKVFDKMDFLAKHGITMHTQIVLCKNINDGEILEQTLEELYKLRPAVKTVAVIPVGLTGHRQKLYPLESFGTEDSDKVIAQVEAFNKKAGGEFCWCSDEFYIKAGRELPPYDSYGDFDQIENGVGLCAEFEEEFLSALDEVEGSGASVNIASITGQSFKDILKSLCEKLKDKYPNVNLRVKDIYNDFFGRSITVAGLITAGDIIKQFKDAPEYTIIPSNMLREFTDTFLDGMTVSELEKALGTRIIVSHGGEDYVKTVDALCKQTQNQSQDKKRGAK